MITASCVFTLTSANRIGNPNGSDLKIKQIYTLIYHYATLPP